MPSTTSTIVAATIGSNHGSEISTNAFGSSEPAENTPRGRPKIGERNPPTSLASSALAIVSPSNPAYSVPSKRKETGLERSIAVPPAGSRRAVTTDPSGRGLPLQRPEPRAHHAHARDVVVGRVQEAVLLDDVHPLVVLDEEAIVQVVAVGQRLHLHRLDGPNVIRRLEPAAEHDLGDLVRRRPAPLVVRGQAAEVDLLVQDGGQRGPVLDDDRVHERAGELGSVHRRRP